MTLNSESLESKDELNSFFEGFLDSIPLVISFAFVFFAIGQITNKAGLDVFQSLAITLFVFAAPAELVIANFVIELDWLAMIISSCVINFRFILMSTLLLPYFQKQSKLALLGTLFTLNGSTFIVSFLKIKEGKTHPFAYFLGISVSAFVAASVATVIGFLMTGSIPKAIQPLLSMIIPIHFTILIAKSWAKKGFIFAAIIGFTLTSLITPYMGRWTLLFVALTTGSLMMVIEQNLKV